jgi:hypothetical protein
MLERYQEMGDPRAFGRVIITPGASVGRQ